MISKSSLKSAEKKVLKIQIHLKSLPKKSVLKNQKAKNPNILWFSNIIDFTRDLSKGDEFELEAKISGNFLKILPNSLRDKMRIFEHLKHKIFQFYIISDREIPVKGIIRGLPTSTDIEELKESFMIKGFTIIKISQLKSRRGQYKLLPLL